MAPLRVDVKPALLRWARQRARVSANELARAFPDLAAWESRERRPTLKQLERYAKRTHAPIGFFFLPEPPDESLPIPDFRTHRSDGVERPSADLLDTIYLCQQRQDWFRDHAETNAADALNFIGSVVPESNVVAAAATIRASLGLDVDARRSMRTWEEALTRMVRSAEELGILVMRSGVVGNNTHRPLDPDEFRGFALSDRLAPLIFVNAADSKSGQMFTLAHELVHLFSDRTGVSDSSPRRIATRGFERWCNAVAAELLVPLAAFDVAYDRAAELRPEVQRLARHFKVSTLVVLRRMHDAGGFTRDEFWTHYSVELDRLKAVAPKGSGGDFHATEAVRVSRRFATALVSSTLEGQTLYRDAFRLLAISKTQTFEEFGKSLGVVG